MGGKNRMNQIGAALGLGLLAVAGWYASALPFSTAVAADATEDAVEDRTTELVRTFLNKSKVKAEFVDSSTPYLRVHRDDWKVAFPAVENALKTACKEVKGTTNALLNRNYVTLGGVDAARGRTPSWPTGRAEAQTDRLELLMDTRESGRHETLGFVGETCLLRNKADAVLVASESRPGADPYAEVRPNYVRFYDEPDIYRVYWFSLSSFDKYADRVPALRAGLQARQLAMGESIRPQLQALDARQAEKNLRNEQTATAAKVRRDAIATQGAQRFASASAATKEVGMTICSSDNRLGYVEQVAGPRVKVMLKGRAIGTYEEFGELGPFKLGGVRAVALGEPEPIEDANFLFQPLQRQVRFADLEGLIWDEGRYWGMCAFR